MVPRKISDEAEESGNEDGMDENSDNDTTDEGGDYKSDFLLTMELLKGKTRQCTSKVI